MKKLRNFTLLTLLLVVALVLASCGGSTGSGGSQQENNGSSGGAQGSKAEEATSMQGMDHGDMQGMDHGEMGSGGMASEMVMEDGKYSDKAFIDAMVPHHRGAVEMAEVALNEAEHREIKRLARDVVSAQQAEIELLGDIRKEEFGSSESPGHMSAEEMKMMGMTDPQELAKQEPFDKAFIDAMIPHHRSAIAMASVALEKSDNPKIKEIARDIVEAQMREIQQMTGWRQQWYS